RHLRRIEDAVTTSSVIDQMDHDDGASATVQRSIYVPMHPAGQGSALVLIDDSSVPVDAQERARSVLENIVDILVSLVDRRDPNASDHSRRTAEVAKAIAEEMNLDPGLVDAVD